VNLSEISIKNPVFAWMLMAAMILFGWISMRQMGISEMPDVDFPVVNVAVTYEGAAPEIMETDVVDVIEESVMTIQGIRDVSSTSRQGEASITIEFDLNRDIDAALQEVQTKIAQAQRNLPHEMDPPIITKTNPEDQPILWIGLSGDKPLRDIIEYARDHVKDQLQTVGGVGEVIFSGYVDPNLRVWIDPNKLEALELTVKDVIDAIGREHIEIPAGRLETPTKELNIRSLGEAMTPEAFAKIPIKKRGNNAIYKPIFIGDVATVEKGLADIRRISRTQGQTAVGMGVKKQRGSNAVAVADAVLAKLKDVDKTLPPGFHTQVNFDTTKFIRENTSELQFNLILSAVLTAVVCLLFLASWGSTFNILMAIPTSIIGSFLVLNFLGFTLNTFTLLGLTLAIGIVVDDAIMVLENIVRHQEMGKSPVQAALDGSKEITGAAVAATIAIIAIFIPVIFMKGIIGKFFFQFGITMSVAVLFSLLEALTLTPMRTSRFLAAHQEEKWFPRMVNRTFKRLAKVYAKILRVCLNNRWIVLLLAVAFFVASFSVLPGLRKELVPPQDQGAFLIRLTTPLGSSLQFTSDKMKIAEKLISDLPEVQRYFSAVGGFTGGDVNSGAIFVTLLDRKDRPYDPALKRRPTQTDTMNYLRDAIGKIPDLVPVLQDLSTRGFTAQRGFPVEFTVRGPDWKTLTDSSAKLLAKMKASPFFTDVDTDYQFGLREIQIIPNRTAAAARGVSMEDIGTVINALMGGVRSGKFTENGRRDDIRIRLGEAYRQKSADIDKIYVRNQFGELIKIKDVIDVKEVDSLKSITRRSRERAIGIFSNVAPGQSQDKALKEVERLAAEDLPQGYRIVFSGSAQTFKESFQSLLFALYLGIIVAYMVLGSQYNSFIHPFTVLLALPFSVSGAWLALRISDNSLNIFSFIGLILLMGIVKKNSILLVDFTNQRRREGLDKTEALMTACPQRLRPILMTSFATIAAAIPPALALGSGAETRIPMAVVILGGVTISTLLTLFVVPCAYSLLARLERKPRTA